MNLTPLESARYSIKIQREHLRECITVLQAALAAKQGDTKLFKKRFGFRPSQLDARIKRAVGD